jgi:hypothetical protein
MNTARAANISLNNTVISSRTSGGYSSDSEMEAFKKEFESKEREYR